MGIGVAGWVAIAGLLLGVGSQIMQYDQARKRANEAYDREQREAQARAQYEQDVYDWNLKRDYAAWEHQMGVMEAQAARDQEIFQKEMEAYNIAVKAHQENIRNANEAFKADMELLDKRSEQLTAANQEANQRREEQEKRQHAAAKVDAAESGFAMGGVSNLRMLTNVLMQGSVDEAINDWNESNSLAQIEAQRKKLGTDRDSRINSSLPPTAPLAPSEPVMPGEPIPGPRPLGVIDHGAPSGPNPWMTGLQIAGTAVKGAAGLHSAGVFDGMSFGGGYNYTPYTWRNP
jgi:hypothetical protein